MDKQLKLKVAKEIKTVFEDKTINNVEKLKRIDVIVVRCTAEQKKEYAEVAKVKKMPLSRLIRSSMNTTVRAHNLQPKKTEAELRADFVKFKTFVQSL